MKLNNKINRANALDANGDCLEAMAFAWQTKQRLDNKTNKLPSFTESRKEKS